MGKKHYSMVIFHSYVSLPKGNLLLVMINLHFVGLTIILPWQYTGDIVHVTYPKLRFQYLVSIDDRIFQISKNQLKHIIIGSMYAIYGNMYHQYIPNVSIYTIHGSYGI